MALSGTGIELLPPLVRPRREVEQVSSLTWISLATLRPLPSSSRLRQTEFGIDQ